MDNRKITLVTLQQHQFVMYTYIDNSSYLQDTNKNHIAKNRDVQHS